MNVFEKNFFCCIENRVVNIFNWSIFNLIFKLIQISKKNTLKNKNLSLYARIVFC